MDVANVRDALSGAHFSGWHPSSTSSSSSSSSPPQPPSHPPFVIGIYTITTHLLLSSHFYNYFFSSVCLVHWLRMLLFLRNQTALQSSRFSSTLSIWLNIQHLASPRIRTYMRTYLFDFFLISRMALIAKLEKQNRDLNYNDFLVFSSWREKLNGVCMCCLWMCALIRFGFDLRVVSPWNRGLWRYSIGENYSVWHDHSTTTRSQSCAS